MQILINVPARSVPRFAVHELAYLLASRTDVSADRSRAWLGIPSAEEDREAVSLGLSSLVARGLIEEEQGTILPRNEAGLVGFALGTASKWITVTLRVAGALDVAQFIQGEGIALMARHAPAATIDFVPIKQNYDADVAAIAAIERALGPNFDFALLIRAATKVGECGMFVRNEASSGWRIGFDPVFPGDVKWPAPDLELTASNRADILSAAARLVRHGQGEQ